MSIASRKSLIAFFVLWIAVRSRITPERAEKLYSEALASFEDAGPEDTYDQRDATGFIRLQGLRLPKL